jgi:hypothetical protein
VSADVDPLQSFDRRHLGHELGVWSSRVSSGIAAAQIVIGMLMLVRFLLFSATAAFAVAGPCLIVLGCLSFARIWRGPSNSG